MPFLSPTVPVNINPDGTYTLTLSVTYEGRDTAFTVPAGFQTDLASVPRFLTWLVPVAGVQDRAAVIHDWLCTDLEETWEASREGHAKVRAGGVGVIYEPQASAVDTDGIFRRILRELGVPLVRRWLLWTGVRWGALANPARRPGWIKTAPAVVGISALALPLLLVAVVPVLLVLAVDRAVEAVR